MPVKALPTVAQLLRREGTGISWCDLTFNPWLGCTKVAPPCDHCYAEDLMGTEGTRLKRVGWGAGEERQRTSPSTWGKVRRWQLVAAAAGVSLQVFCLSLGDWADNEVPDEWRLDLADLIRATPNLQWMLLTKRIPNAAKMLRAMFPEGVPPNVALGITVAMQKEADRDIPRARAVKAELGIRRLFLSMEPLLEAVDISAHLPDGDIDLVIVGGESGKKARPMHPRWAVSLMEQCVAAGVPFHFKQWGDWQPILYTGTRAGRVSMHGKTYEGDNIYHFPDVQPVVRVGTKKAGRMMHGREFQERLAA